MNIANIWDQWVDAGKFSGVFSVSGEQGVLFEKCLGERNRGENLPNNRDTAFGIASGTKMFTGLAVCKLIEEGKLNLEDRIWDVLPYDLQQIDRRVTILHLLTHTSGIGDYIDEESDDSVQQMRDLYRKFPVYFWERLEYYLQMITPLPPKFTPGERFGYCNAGFAILGLAVEAASGVPFQEYVKDNIIAPCGLEHTGFYRMDSLPANTALGYIEDAQNGGWRSNIFNMPIVGGADGGIFTRADDLVRLWHGVFSNKVLSSDMLSAFLSPQVARSENKSYGLGVYRYERDHKLAYYAVGGDFGVDFFTVYLPAERIVASALGNTETNLSSLLNALLS